MTLKPWSGRVAERTNALALKTSEGNTSQGSNPCPSVRAILACMSRLLGNHFGPSGKVKKAYSKKAAHEAAALHGKKAYECDFPGCTYAGKPAWHIGSKSG
jgi:hypothetical protein